MSTKSRIELLKKIEKSAQVTEQKQTDATAQDKELAWNVFDDLFDQVLQEEASKLNI